MKLRKTGEIKRRANKGAFPWFILIIILMMGYGVYWLAQNPPALPQLSFSLPNLSIPFLGQSDQRLLILYVPGVDAGLLEQWREDLTAIHTLAEKGTHQEIQPAAPVIPSHNWKAMVTGKVPLLAASSLFSSFELSGTPFVPIVPDATDTNNTFNNNDTDYFWTVLEQHNISTVRFDKYLENETEDLFGQFEQEISDRTAQIISALKEDAALCIFAELHSVLTITQQFYPCTDQGHPLYDAERSPAQLERLKQVYIELDRMVQTISNELQNGQTQIILISDQGLPTAMYQVNVNTWLWNNEYLKLKEGVDVDALASLPLQNFLDAVDWQQTQVFSNGMGCVFIHFVETEQNSLISGVQWDTLRMNVQEKLRGWKDHRWITMNNPVVQSLIVNDAVITSGPYHQAKQPDFQIQFQPEYTVSPVSRSGMIEPEHNLIRTISQPVQTQTYHTKPGVILSNEIIPIPERATVTALAQIVFEKFETRQTPQ